MQAFPIDPYLDAITAALGQAAFVLLKAEPGAGKTSRVPEALLAVYDRILVVQPRRLAARLAAEWLAQRRNQALGGEIGYQIRLDNQTSAATRVTFVTEGVLTRKILQDRRLSAYDVIVLDEFHERHIHTDLALAMLKELQEERADLKVLIMSATIDLLPLRAYLGDVPSFEIPGRTFPVSVRYRPAAPRTPLEDQVSAAVAAMREEVEGNILVFLSGWSEIAVCSERLKARFGTSLELIPLTADLAGNYQKIYEDKGRVKVILSTNVAETSVTLPDIRGVIDSGWAKISGFAPWSGLPTLERQRISQASATQRAGRAGRVAPGVCYRLYSELDFQGRAAFTEPEIQRIDLGQTLLEVQAIFPDRAAAWDQLAWFEAPDSDSVAAQRQLLLRLGALDEEGFLTPLGQKMSQLPLHPRLARLALEGQKQGRGEMTLLAALLIHEGMLLRRGELPREHGLCDVSHQLQVLLSASPPDRQKAQRIRQLYESLKRSLSLQIPFSRIEIDEASVRRAVFVAFADRVAKYRPLATRGPRSQRHYNFCLGRGGILSESSVVREAEWIVAVDARETLGDEGGQRCHIEIVSAIEPSWLDEDPFALTAGESEVSIDPKTEKARKILQRLYGKLVVSETQEQVAGEELALILMACVKEKWPEIEGSDEGLRGYHAKLKLLDKHGLEHKLPSFVGEYRDLLISYLCENSRSLTEVLKKDIRRAIDEQLDYEDLQHLATACPDSIKLANGRKLSVHYPLEGEPWIEARIQEFFGQADTPTICLGRQKLLIKLLAPNRRPAQMTQDLRGFWLGSYHEVKKELKRRYPKHAWPDDPLTASPPEPRRP